MNVDEQTFEISDDVKALLSEQKLTSLVNAFTQLDANGDGKIELTEYLAFALGQEQENLTKKFEALDRDRDGHVEFEEFVMATEPTFQILKKFRELDLNHNGLLSLEEAIYIAEQLVFPLSSVQVKTILEQVDRDGDGQITYYEYLGAIAHVGFQ